MHGTRFFHLEHRHSAFIAKYARQSKNKPDNRLAHPVLSIAILSHKIFGNSSLSAQRLNRPNTAKPLQN